MEYVLTVWFIFMFTCALLACGGEHGDWKFGLLIFVMSFLLPFAGKGIFQLSVGFLHLLQFK